MDYIVLRGFGCGMYYNVFVCYKFFRCSCIYIHWASPRHYTVVDPMLLPLGNPFKRHEDVLSLKAMIPPSVFDIFYPCVGRPEVLDAFRFFFKQQQLIGFDCLIDWILT